MKIASHYPLALGSVLLLADLAAGSAEKLEQDFVNPTASARPHTWWHWMNDRSTKEGITADLEAMARIGIGGAQIFNVAQHNEKGQCIVPPGPVKLLSPEWRALTEVN